MSHLSWTSCALIGCVILFAFCAGASLPARRNRWKRVDRAPVDTRPDCFRDIPGLTK